MSDKPQTVIIGASYAGAYVATRLASSSKGAASVVVLERKSGDVFFHKYGATRAAVLGSHGWTERALSSTGFADAENIRYVDGAVATSIDEDKRTVTYEREGETQSVDYDVLVLASGSDNFLVDGNTPTTSKTKKDVADRLARIEDAVRSSDAVAVVGGGIVGMEIGAEIRAAYPSKTVTVVDANPHVLAGVGMPNTTQRFKKRLRAKVEALGVQMRYGVRATDVRPESDPISRPVNGALSLEDGTAVACDVVVWAIGAKPNVSFVPLTWLDESGRVKVDATCRASERVFALGDCSDVNEAKFGLLTEFQAAYVARAIPKVLKGKTPKKYVRNRQGVFIVALGPRVGIVHHPSVSWSSTLSGSFVASLIKGKGLFARKVWGQIGAGTPINIPKSRVTE